MRIEEIPTPALLLDQAKLEKNIQRMKNHLRALGTSLRLHGKTCKNMDIASLCGADESIAVSTLGEAEYFASAGIKDIIYAAGISPVKFHRVLELRKRGVSLAIILDCPEMADMVADFGKKTRHAFDVLLEIDCDGHRAGLNPDSENLLRTAYVLANGGQNIKGVLTHAGSAYDLNNPGPEAFQKLSLRENERALKAAAALRENGHSCPVISVGSTPTALYGNDFNNITEARAGVFPFMDCVMAALGVCAPADIALSVLCSVTGFRAGDGAVIVDAGWTALSADRGIESRFSQYGYGLVSDIHGHILPGMRIAALNQEHGIISGTRQKGIKIGDMLRILPAHACAAANSFDGYHVLNGNKTTSFWPRCQGW